jgi:subtilisin family serine protease
VIEEIPVAQLGGPARRLLVPEGLTLLQARAAVRDLPSGRSADFNHYYRSEQDIVAASVEEPDQTAVPCDGLHCPAFEQIGWPVMPSRDAVCGTPVTIGMVDTGLNPDHETFASASIDVIRLTDDRLEPSRAIHGTAVAAILTGDPASRSPGLMPHVPLVAVDVFHRDQGDERADVFSLVRALDLLAERNVRVVNLSLAGPRNRVLAETIRRLIDEDQIVVIAAAGNDGPRADPAYPAAYPGVIAVTAVRPDNSIYRRAGRGDHIDIAAPGVDVWTAASISGARPKTGTSFASPFVAAAAALILEEDPTRTPQDVAEILFASATDLGAAGPDEVFGNGLLSVAGICD